MKTFKMNRGFDESGVSGTGLVLEGCVFTDGTCVVRWLTPKAPHSTGVYNSFLDFEFIHITSHPDNITEIIWNTNEK